MGLLVERNQSLVKEFSVTRMVGRLAWCLVTNGLGTRGVLRAACCCNAWIPKYSVLRSIREVAVRLSRGTFHAHHIVSRIQRKAFPFRFSHDPHFHLIASAGVDNFAFHWGYIIPSISAIAPMRKVNHGFRAVNNKSSSPRLSHGFDFSF